MKTIVVHGIPGSPYTRMPLMALEEKGLPWRLAALRFGENRLPAYLQHQPFGKIPAFDVDGFEFYETQAFMRYVERLAPQPRLIPEDAQQEARMNQVMGICDCYVMADVTGVISFLRRVAPRFGLPVDEAKIADAVPKAQVCMAALSGILGDQAFFAGAKLSLADISAFPHMDFFEQTGEGKALLADYPALLRWLTAMRARASVHATEWERLSEITGSPPPPPLTGQA